LHTHTKEQAMNQIYKIKEVELPIEDTILDKAVHKSKIESIIRAFEWCERDKTGEDSYQVLRYNLCIFASIVETYFDDLVLQTKRIASYKAIQTRVENVLSKPSKIKVIPWGLKKVDDQLEFINDDYSKLFELVCQYKVLNGFSEDKLFNIISKEAGNLLNLTLPPNEKGENTSNKDQKWKREGDLDRVMRRYKVM